MKTKPKLNLSRLTEAQRDELLALLEDQRGGEGLADFITRNFPHQPPPRHLMPLIDLFERARHEQVRACLSMPPGHGKTITIKRAFSWWLTHTPADLCAYATHSEHKAWSESRRARAMARQTGVELKDDTQAVAEWRTPFDGGLLSVGTKGLTGHRVTGVLVVDDPYQDRKDAESVAVRESVWEWFGEVALTRLEGASCIVVHTRWTPDDLIGRLGAMGWETVNLPAVAEEGDLLGRQVGEALWSDMYPFDKLEEIRTGPAGEWSFAALYQGRPTPRGHRVFGEPHHYESLPDGLRYVVGCDPAATASTRADYSVAVVLATQGRGAQAQGYVVDVVRRQCEIPDFVGVLRALSDKYGHARVVVESVGGFKAVPQVLRRLDPQLRVSEAKMSGDKFVRAQGAAAAWNAGRLMVPRSALWLKDFVSEATSFTGVGDAHDDQVDALSHSWNASESDAPEVAPDLEDLTKTSWVDLVF